ncbi:MULTISPECIES: permease-like cell division protein FtsX [unclassified Clostridium]|uniref:permease-like cell division protein FtsX n=1 Tax=unclassified Clostridium TaxID=2614128 RepID=UPI0025BA46A1|nr:MULTISPECIES: permease-like cell division protein FtsX [unclassified Clostridium]
MRFDSIKYFVKDAFKSIKRNKTLSIASAATVAATLFILGVVSLTLVNVNKAVNQLGSKVEARVFLKDDIKNEDKDKLKKTIEGVDGVLEVKLETKEQALEKMKEQLQDDSGALVAGFNKKNPLPSSYIVRVNNPKAVDDVLAKIKDAPGIEKIKDARQLIDQVTKLTDSATMIGGITALVFVLVSLFLIGNTIKITVFSRKREIGIMKYVGATDWFIRWPFIIEGILLGILGALISVIILYGLYGFAQTKAADMLLGFNLVARSYILKVTIWQFLLGGMVIGSLASIISMRKFLKV